MQGARNTVENSVAEKTYRQLVVPEEEEILDALGEWPDATEDGARVLTWRDSGGGSLTFSYDVLARSVRVRWISGEGHQVMDVYREGATRLTPTSTSAAKHLSVEFHTGECRGTMEIQVTPHFSVQDRLLFA